MKVIASQGVWKPACVLLVVAAPESENKIILLAELVAVTQNRTEVFTGHY
jgi:hypothetical protein